MKETKKDKKIKGEQFRSEKKCSKGITLISLMITVAVLVILALVTLNIVMDEDFIESADEVVDKTEEHIDQHQQISNEVRNLIR